jgi:uncharacterized membrane protein YgdD (TMEM256/DUF423 family)
MSGRWIIVIAALLGALGVGAGAFGAHSLKSDEMRERFDLTEDDLANYETAVRYQVFHALALLGVGLVARSTTRTASVAFAGGAMIVGILCFSGSIYVLALNGPRWVWPITPIGGSILILAWLALAVAATGLTRPHESRSRSTA